MPGYVIHLAVANEYLRKNINIKENKEEFIRGTIYPDDIDDKSKTHYGLGSSRVRLDKFLLENKINNSFNKGYFLHLVTDYIFYNRYLDIFTNDVYDDYDKINKFLIDKYNVILPEKVKNKVFFKEGKTKILSKELAEEVIEYVSSLNLKLVQKEVEEGQKQWFKYNPKI